MFLPFLLEPLEGFGMAQGSHGRECSEKPPLERSRAFQTEKALAKGLKGGVVREIVGKGGMGGL